MGEAKTKQAKDSEIDKQTQALRPRFVELAASMQDEGNNPVAIVEAALTVATAQMLAVMGPERTSHALAMAAGGIDAAAKAGKQPKH